MATVFHTDKGKKSVTDTGKRVVYKDSDGNIHVRYAWSDYSAVHQGEMDVPIGQPVQTEQSGVAMVSGFSPKIMTAVLNADEFNPLDVMMEALKPIELDYTNLNEELKIKYETEQIGEEY